MQLTINLDYNQIVDLASNMSIEEKLVIYEKIKEDIFKYRFEKLLDYFKTDELSEEEILKEVEYVRTERYKDCN